MKSSTSPCVRFLLATPVLVLAACKTESEHRTAPTQQSMSTTSSSRPAANLPKHVDIVSEFTAAAEVVDIEKEERIVTLRREDGSLLVVRATEDVRNLDQIEAGDKLRVYYKESLSATKLSAGESLRPAQVSVAGDRAEVGQKPAAAAAGTVNARVRIESLDRERDIVVFSLASGELMARRLRTPEGREFLKGLSVGDVVELDYTVAMALGVQKLGAEDSERERDAN